MTTTTKDNTMNTLDFIAAAEKQAVGCFLGLAVPCEKTTVDDLKIVSETVWAFNKKIKNQSCKKNTDYIDPRLVGGCDTMIIKVGIPGSKERVKALAEQYDAILAMNEEVSPFGYNES